MPLRLLPALLLMGIALFISLRNSRHGLFLLVLSIFFNPGSFFWLLDSFHIPMLLGVSTATAAIREGNFSLKDHPLPLQNRLFIILMIFVTLSAVMGEVSSRTFPMLEEWIKLFILFSIIIRLFSEEKQVHRMWLLILLAMGLMAFRGLIHYIQGWDEITGLKGSTMEDRNDFALVLSMSMPFAYFFSRTEKGLLRVGFFLLHVLIILVTIITHSRMGFLLVCGYLFILFLQSRKKLTYLIVMVPLVVIGLSLAPESVLQRANTIQNYEEDASSMGRIRAWKAGIRMMTDRPLTGVGLNSFEIPGIYHRYSDDVPHVAHNAYIQIGAEAGIPALLMYVLIIITTALKLWRLRVSSEEDTQRLFCNAMLVSLILYCCGSIFLSAEDRESFYILVASVGAIWSIREGKIQAAARATQ